MSAQPDQTPGLTTTLLAAVDVAANTRQAVTDRLVGQVAAMLHDFHGWYDDLAVRRLSRQIGSAVSTAQGVTATHEDAFLTHLLEQFSGRSVSPVGQVAVDDLRAGVDPDAVYERLGEQFRYSRSTGASEDKALADVLTRAEVMNGMDVALAARAQDQKVLSVTQLATGYRRVIHPEMSKGGTCGLCIAASDRIYHKHVLMPIHNRCHCSVSPIMRNGADPGNSLNNLDLGDLYQAAGSTSAADLKRTRWQVDDFGELGPTLSPHGATAPASLAS